MALLPSRRTRTRLAALAAAVVVPAATLVPAAEAADQPHPFEVFRDCPAQQMLAEADDASTSCVTAVVTGGTFVIGKGTVPVTKESVLSLGIASVGSGDKTFGTPGKVFTSSPMQVPGGLLGVPGLERLLPGLTDVTATVELATTELPQVDILATIYGGEVVALPVKIRLKNALLGGNCYIGSNADPIVLHLTTEKTGTFEFVPVGETGSLVHAKGGVVVDRSFAVPAATGCGVGGLLNGVVNARQGLPSPAGKNSAVLDQDAYLGGPASQVLAFQQG
ncbi:hypothetical protein [Nocardioides daeguensis]|uniref:Secreted protein n=1 Tax=Nocardioides daeguensis TaxID=908359 RepID=A0ABP6WJ85_9ACTN|nr:hypothetical protein [Nocardioides daeguensis]MBV6729155.1 hypothetical protein [Nocardioides daeguensis]MCR1774841.1 hypothetical protein [Nocardioides daeguensis]